MKKPLLIISLLAAAQLGAACSLFKPRTAPYPSGVAFPVIEDGAVTFKGRPEGGIRARGGSIYLSTRAGIVWCIDAAAKKATWKFDTDNRLLEPPFPGAENIYVRDVDDVLYALSSGGGLLWKRPIGEKILTPVVEGGGRVFFGTSKGNLWSIGLDGKDDRVFQAGGAVTGGPVVSGARVVFYSDDRTIHVRELGGRPVWTHRAPAVIVGPPASDGNSVYFGTEDRWFYCLKIGGTRPKWKARLGGQVAADPVVLGRRLYLPATNSVLYCLDKSGGDIVWWANVPSRTVYDLALAGDKLIAASLSAVLLALDAATGQKAGAFTAPRDIIANAAWVDPFLVIAQHDLTTDEGKLLLLRKEVRISLSAQKVSPQPTGEEIPLSATALGFFEPRYEFYVRSGEKREVAQKASEKNTWTWFASAEGSYTLGVTVTDAKQSREAEIPYTIEKRPEKKPEEPEKKETPK